MRLPEDCPWRGAFASRTRPGGQVSLIAQDAREAGARLGVRHILEGALDNRVHLLVGERL